MNVTIKLIGTSPLLCHSPRMVDPEFSLNREIKAITAKRKKTDSDLQDIERLEWYGGLYEENGVVVQPVAKVRKSLINTAKIMKLGKGIERTLVLDGINTPLIHDGPQTIDEIFAQDRFHSRLSVGVNGKRIMRVRPSFFPWALVVHGVFVQDAGVNVDELQRIVELAGTVEGVGDNRVNGYGRFNATLEIGK